MSLAKSSPVGILRKRRVSALGEPSPERESSSVRSDDGGTEKQQLSPRSLSFYVSNLVRGSNDDDNNNKEEKSGGESPLQHEFRKLNRMASSLAIAMTESHQSDEDTDASNDEMDEELTSDVDDLRDLDNNIDRVEFATGVEPKRAESLSPASTPPRSPILRRSGLSRPTIQPTTSIAEHIVPDSFLGKLDAMDKRLSLPLFQLEFGKAFEAIMLVFGTWFGLPVPAWGLWTSFFGFMDEYVQVLARDSNEDTSKTKNTIVLIVLAFLLYTVSFIRWLKTGKYQSVYGNLKQLAAVPLLFFVTFYYGTVRNGYNAGAYFVVCWVIAEVIGHMFKYCFKRLRPVAYLGELLPKRYVPEVQQMFGKGHTAYESFPSADTIGGAVFSACLWQLGLTTLPQSVALSITIAFSRIYLQAHHIFDVGFGLFLGWTTCLLMWNPFGEERRFGPLHSVFAVWFFVVFALVARKFKHVLPKHMERPKSMYGF